MCPVLCESVGDVRSTTQWADATAVPRKQQPRGGERWLLGVFRVSVASACVSYPRSQLCLVLLSGVREVRRGVDMREDKVKSGWQCVGKVCFVDDDTKYKDCV